MGCCTSCRFQHCRKTPCKQNTVTKQNLQNMVLHLQLEVVQSTLSPLSHLILSGLCEPEVASWVPLSWVGSVQIESRKQLLQQADSRMDTVLLPPHSISVCHSSSYLVQMNITLSFKYKAVMLKRNCTLDHQDVDHQLTHSEG